MMIATQKVSCFHCGSEQARPVTLTRDYNYKTCDNEFEFVGCAGCGQVYLRNRPDISALSVIYPTDYEAYAPPQEQGESLLTRIKQHFIAKKIAPLRAACPPGASILEVGCGAGELMRLIRRHGDSSWKLYGMDITSTHFPALQALGVTTIASRFEDAEGYDGQFDAILMNQVIEHLADPGEIIRKARRMLKQGGVLIMETPSLEGWDAALFARHGLWEGWHAPRHWQVFNRKTLEAVVIKNGMQVAKVEYILSPYLWIYSLRAWLEFHRWPAWLYQSLNLQNFLALCTVGMADVLQLLLRGKTSNMRLTARNA